ncbi:MAG: polysulfide reductase NrfD [Verrucomicrobia bacterium]|nr:polysulfide reductase NrfD [Verrucomicrobiota bacterium]
MNPNVPNPSTDAAASHSLLPRGHTYGSVTEKISEVVLTTRTPWSWLFGFSVGFTLLMVLMMAVAWLFYRGVGIWGVQVPVGWGFAIVNFVWWIGIGHAGTLISAILLLFRQEWRTSINRFAEAMTLFAVACAAIFPLLHLGRPWVFYWLFPYPDTMRLWPQWRSPLVWDVFAVSTYATVSFMFWYVGLLPDLGNMRDRARNRFVRVLYGMMAMGWRGAATHWHRYKIAYLLLAGLSTPLVLSVHSVVSMDFTIGIVPGWHSTIFPPYFVAGAIFSGFAMVMTLTIPVRKIYHLEEFFTIRHLDNMAKVLLATGMMVSYGYLMETFMAWYSHGKFEIYAVINRASGPYAVFFWAMIACNVLAPQVFWFKKARQHIPTLFVISLVVNLGMWLERFVIVIVSLHRDFMPSAWAMYYPTIWDWATLFGSIGLFLTLMLLFIRFLPMISMFELREQVAEQTEKKEAPR